MAIVHVCTMAIVHACAIAIVHACTMATVHACTMAIGDACTIATEMRVLYSHGKCMYYGRIEHARCMAIGHA